MSKIESALKIANEIQVTGKANLDRLLAVIILLEKEKEEQERYESNIQQEIQNETN